MENEKIDIAIVGGGVSGVYSAWKLKKKYPEKKIVLFEGSDHIGGRLLSVVPPGIPNMVAELGGMRILPATQVLISKLIEQLNKELRGKRKIELYDFPVSEAKNIAYLRGVYLRLADLSNNSPKVPYQLSYNERGDMNNILVSAIKQIVPGITNIKLNTEERLAITHKAMFKGELLYKQGFWNVLYQIISGEAYKFSMDSGGYDSIMVNWNAADAIPWFLADFGIDPVYKGFKNGFQQVPIAMGDLFQSVKGTIKLNTKLTKFSWNKADMNFTISLDENKENKTYTADKLILAMPRRSLDLLMPANPLLKKIQQLISSVTARPLFKVFTTYSNAWWQAAGVTRGRSVTDLPIRQTYYWPYRNGEPVLEGKAMLLASYDDGGNIGFWDGLRPQRKIAWATGGSHTLEDPFIGIDTDSSEVSADSINNQQVSTMNQQWEQYKAPHAMITEMAKQLNEMHDLSYAPEVRSACFRDWGEDPYGGGWNSWNMGVNSEEVKRRIVSPFNNEIPLFICGEAYSDSQGWVEGALQTADMVLKKI